MKMTRTQQFCRMKAHMFDHSDSSAEKVRIRLLMKNMRNLLCVPEDAAAGEKILCRILGIRGLLDHAPAQAVVGLYAPIHMEADLLSQAGLLRRRGFRTALPRVCGDELSFSVIEDDEVDLQPGAFGIMEPLRDADSVSMGEIYAICVPGLAFDREGARLGYGKGYYDRFLNSPALVKLPVLIGVGYDFQLVDSLPQGPHDLKLDYIVTPSRVITVRGMEQYSDNV